MEEVYFPKELIFTDSQIKIELEEVLPVNHTSKAIVISGNRNGFLSLSNLLNVYSAYLCDPIVVTEFPFVASSIVLEVVIDEKLTGLPDGQVIRRESGVFEWRLHETALFIATGSIHSLGYANPELHFDDSLPEDAISVYCIVD